MNNELQIYDSSNYQLNKNNDLYLLDNLNMLQYLNYYLDYLKLYVDIKKGEKKSMKQLDKWITYNCEYCGKEKEVLKSHYNKVQHHYCSNECRISAMKK